LLENANVDIVFDDGISKVTGLASTTQTLLLLILLGDGVTSRMMVAGTACWKNANVDVVFDDGVGKVTGSASTTWTLLLLLILLGDGVTSCTTAAGTACWKIVDEEDVDVDKVVDNGAGEMTGSASTTWTLLLLVLLLMLWCYITCNGSGHSLLEKSRC